MLFRIPTLWSSGADLYFDRLLAAVFGNSITERITQAVCSLASIRGTAHPTSTAAITVAAILQ